MANYLYAQQPDSPVNRLTHMGWRNGERLKREPVEGKLYCTMCGQWLPTSGFYRRKGTGWECYCKSCCSLRSACSHYGLSRPEMESMISNSNGACQLCGDQMLHACVDHCHKTGRVRGLICPSCNHLLSWFDKRPDLISRAVAYLASS